MKVIILAAGVGSRLRPITNTKPKCLVKVCGKSIIEWQIEAYLSAGIKQKEIYLLIGYKASQIRELIGCKYNEINYIENEIYDKTNNMYSLKLGLDSIILEKKDLLIISNGDCIYDFSIVTSLLRNRNENLIPCEKDVYFEENMKISIRDNYIEDISKKILETDFYGTSIDIYKLSSDSVLKLKKIIENIIAQDKNSWTEVALDILFKNIQAVPMIINGKKWMEIDNIDDLVTAETIFTKFSINQKKAIVLDLDGTVYLGNTPIPSAIEFINNNATKYSFFFMTNNTSKSKNKYIQKLKEFGVHKVTEHQIITPVLPMINYLNQNDIRNIYVIGTESLKEELRMNRLNCLDEKNYEQADAVILGYDTELNYEKIKRGSRLLHNKSIRYFATHQDMVCPTEFGDIPDIGSFVKMFEIATNRKPELFFGKPNTILLEKVLNKYSKNDIVVVGDRLYTDKILADNSEIDFICVLSGETNREDIEKIEKWPSLIIKELGDFKEI